MIITLIMECDINWCHFSTDNVQQVELIYIVQRLRPIKAKSEQKIHLNCRIQNTEQTA